MFNAEISDAGVFSLRLHGGGWYLSDHFTLSEFACKDGSDLIVVHPQLVAGLEEIRTAIGAPLFLTNAFRTHSHNKSVGGHFQSAHLWGMAADVYSPRVQIWEIYEAAEALLFGGIGRYDNFIHVDVKGFNRRWGDALEGPSNSNGS